MNLNISISLTIVLALLLAVVWGVRYGLRRGLIALALRAVWVAPLFTVFYPEKISKVQNNKPTTSELNILLDDSQSMKQGKLLSSRLAQAENLIESFKQGCKQQGCSVKVRNLSTLTDGFSPDKTALGHGLESFLAMYGSSDWALISDGGDMNPTSLPNIPKGTHSGFIFSAIDEEEPNIWLSNFDAPAFGFDGKPIRVSVSVHRNKESRAAANIQVQALIDGAPVGGKNIKFQEREYQKNIYLDLPASAKGHHLISLKSIPTEGEVLLYDNVISSHFETVPNTIGVLHLSGSPSADARYMRRFIKSEPKFDLISFFILRDPWDTQKVSEREMSLIPFPVEKLFTTELANFKLVVIQNFRMLQFLNAKYQKNLVEFVKNGGGVLFVGGPRAFNESDLSSSNMKELVPFSLREGAASNRGSDRYGFMTTTGNNDVRSEKSPWYDQSLDFTVGLADINDEKRELATIYEDLLEISSELSQISGLSGLHHMENVVFQKDAYTPIFEAETQRGRMPLLSASYPGKGRALWLYTDQIWKLTKSNGAYRDLYNQLMQKMFGWLIRDDIKKPLRISDFQVFVDEGATEFRVRALGAAVRYYEQGKDWKLEICNRKLSPKDFTALKLSDTEMLLKGSFKNATLDGRVCSLKIEAVHSSFGSEKVTSMAYINKTFSDEQMPYSMTYLDKVAELTGSKLVAVGKAEKLVSSYFSAKNSGVAGKAGAARTKEISALNPYWFLASWWFALCLIALPLEVLVRRANKIFI